MAKPLKKKKTSKEFPQSNNGYLQKNQKNKKLYG